MRLKLILWIQLICSFNLYTQSTFIKTYPDPDESTFVHNALREIPSTGDLVMMIPTSPNNQRCMKIRCTDTDGNVKWEKYKKHLIENFDVLETRHDTIFYSGFSSMIGIDSTGYWYFGMMTSDGDSIAEYRFKTLHDSERGLLSDGNTAQFPQNLGMVLMPDKEIILYGIGLDKSPNPKKAPYRTLCMRIGMDGVQKSGLLWYEVSNLPERRMRDAMCGPDGNFYFNLFAQALGLGPTSLFSFIIKLDKQNKFSIVGYSRSMDNINMPRFAVDKNRNFTFHTLVSRSSVEYNNSNNNDLQSVVSIDSVGTLRWDTIIRPILKIPIKDIKFENMRTNRVGICKNNDVLFAGYVSLTDSMYVDTLKTNRLIIGFVPWIARLNDQGGEVWRHIFAPMANRKAILYDEFIGMTLRDIIEAENGDIIVCGAITRDNSSGRSDPLLIRLNAKGCLDDDCSHVNKYWQFPWYPLTATEDPLGDDEVDVKIIPNPASTNIMVVGFEVKEYAIYNQNGSLLSLGRIEDSSIDISHLTSGLYILKCLDGSSKIGHAKFIKQ
jgi:hypothetical protein